MLEEDVLLNFKYRENKIFGQHGESLVRNIEMSGLYQRDAGTSELPNILDVLIDIC